MASNGDSSWGLSDSSIVWTLAIVILVALGLLALLRHSFTLSVSGGAS